MKEDEKILRITKLRNFIKCEGRNNKYYLKIRCLLFKTGEADKQCQCYVRQISLVNTFIKISTKLF